MYSNLDSENLWRMRTGVRAPGSNNLIDGDAGSRVEAETYADADADADAGMNAGVGMGAVWNMASYQSPAGQVELVL